MCFPNKNSTQLSPVFSSPRWRWRDPRPAAWWPGASLWRRRRSSPPPPRWPRSGRSGRRSAGWCRRPPGRTVGCLLVKRVDFSKSRKNHFKKNEINRRCGCETAKGMWKYRWDCWLENSKLEERRRKRSLWKIMGLSTSCVQQSECGMAKLPLRPKPMSPVHSKNSVWNNSKAFFHYAQVVPNHMFEFEPTISPFAKKLHWFPASKDLWGNASRSCRSLGSTSCMKPCPPKPGGTVMASTASKPSAAWLKTF